MTRLPRFLRTLTVACTISPLFVITHSLSAQDAAPAVPAAPAEPATPAPATPATPAAPTDSATLKTVEDFWHFASIGRYQLAKTELDKVLAGADPLEVLNSFEAVVDRRNRLASGPAKVDLYERLFAWQQTPELKDSIAQLVDVFNKAKATRSADTAFIEQNIQRLGTNRRAYLLALEQLKQSGELAVPIMIATLQDPKKRDLNIPVRSALRDMGHRSLNPLLAATEMKDWNTLPWVIAILGDLGYDAAVPYLVRLYKSPETPGATKSAVREALLRLQVPDPDTLDPAQLFYQLAEKFYYGKSSISTHPDATVGHVWQWSGSILDKKDVPAPTFNEHMAMRACEYTLSIDAARSDAVSLWLAAAYRRQVELPKDAADPMWDERHPSAHYYAVNSGTKHLNPTLARALRDREPAVALLAIRSLQEIVGPANLFTGDNQPLFDALRYPDRRVRFEAAFTFAASLPQRRFDGQEHIVPILAEAMSQTGKAGVLVLAGTQDELNQQAELIGKAGPYTVTGGTTPQAMLSAANTLNGVDVIIVSEKDVAAIEALWKEMHNNLRMARTSTLIRVTSKVASRFAQAAMNDPLITLTDAADEAALGKAIEEARQRAGGLPLDEAAASEYALRAAQLMAKLAIDHGQVLDLAVGRSAVMAALDDARPEIAKAAGNVLALLEGKDIQMALALKGTGEKATEDLRISFLKDLATNAKFFGNQLEQAQVDALTALVANAASLELRSAAAEAHGALRLSSEQVKTLILNQSKR